MGDFAVDPDTKLGPVALTIPNLARALRFYEDALGLRTFEQQDNATVLGANGGPPLLVLTEQPDAPAKPPRTTGLYHLAILLPSRADLARVLHRLVERRYPLQGAADHGVSEALYLADPDGNGIEIYIDRPSDEWPWRESQLQMGTDPLDVRGLLSQDDGHWNGLPPATRIGHVHLQVADLGRAEAFYGNVLGFDLMQRYPVQASALPASTGGSARSGTSALFLSAGGYHHHIGLNTWAGVGAPAPPPDAVGLRYFTICLPDEAALARVTERLRSAGVPVEQRTSETEMTRALLLRDPSGNGIVLDTQTGALE